MLTLQQRIYLVKCYGIGDVSYKYAINLFNVKFSDVSVSINTAKSIVKKFDRTGSVSDIKKSKKSYNEEDAATILAVNSVNENPKLSLRKRAEELDISKSLLQKIFQVTKFHPYKPKFTHTIELEDEGRRLEFCLWVGEKVLDNRGFCNSILFSDEANFSTNGVIASQNCRYWAQENPNFIVHCRNQRYKKVNVWCGIFGDKIIGPYFFEQNLNQYEYLNMLNNFLIPSLEDVNLNARRLMYFQQDGCPAHSTRIVREWLDRQFPEKWIGRYGPVQWPARSPDLTPLDFYLWGYLKQKVYAQNLGNDLEILKQRIRDAISEINVITLRNVYNEFRKRVETCVNVGGSYFE